MVGWRSGVDERTEWAVVLTRSWSMKRSSPWSSDAIWVDVTISDAAPVTPRVDTVS